MQSVVNEKHVFLLRSALAQVFPCAGIVSFTQPELYGAHFTALTTPFLRHSARIEDGPTNLLPAKKWNTLNLELYIGEFKANAWIQVGIMVLGLLD